MVAGEVARGNKQLGVGQGRRPRRIIEVRHEYNGQNIRDGGGLPNLEKIMKASLEIRARTDLAYEFPDQTRPDNRIFWTGPAGL